MMTIDNEETKVKNKICEFFPCDNIWPWITLVDYLNPIDLQESLTDIFPNRQIQFEIPLTLPPHLMRHG